MFKSSWDILAIGNLNHWSGCLSTVSYVSLGCPKALVDSEHIVTALADENFEVVGENSDASVIIINTCGFIDQAKSESYAAIETAMELSLIHI